MRKRNVFIPRLSRRRSSVKVKRGLGVRHLQTFLLFLCISLSTITRSSVDHAHNILIELPEFKVENETDELDNYRFFSLTYGISKVLGGYIGTKINNKSILVFYGILTTILQYSSPSIIMHFGINGFRAVRFLVGLVQGIASPQVYNQITRWIPQTEIYLLVPIILSGYFFGFSVTLAFGPDLVTSANGWKTPFYFTGNCGLIWSLAFLGLGAQEPESCYLISAEEKDYIESNLGFSVKGSFRRKLPVRAMLTNITTYTLLACQVAFQYGMYSSVVMTPKLVMERGLKNSGILAGAPFFISVFFVFFVTLLADYLIKADKITIRKLRFISNSIAFYGKAAVILICADAVTVRAQVALHTVAILLESLIFLGYKTVFFDVAPNFAGFYYGLITGPGYIGSTLGRYTLLYLHNNYGWDLAWRGTLNFNAVAYLLANLFFVGFTSVEIQNFNFFDEEFFENDE